MYCFLRRFTSNYVLSRTGHRCFVPHAHPYANKLPNRKHTILVTETLSRCVFCQFHFHQLPAVVTAGFHTTTHLAVGKRKNTKKKLIEKIRFKKKSVKSEWEALTIRPNMTVSEVAQAMNRDIDDVFEAMLYFPNTDNYDKPNSVITDFSIIVKILEKCAFRWKRQGKTTTTTVKENKDIARRPPPDPAVLVKRAPVVTIMGHVDHGKTTLLDALRKSNIVEKEFGGITQHIGAFSVTLKSGDTITFLDTPGHAAFSAMRARGARITDIIVLVIAAEDGVMKQTMESIQHARKADVPLIIAINKIDKFQSDVEKTKLMLLHQGVQLEEHGGDVQVVPISALKRINLDELQEAIITLSELLELRGDPTGATEGVVIEAKTEIGKGKLATIIIERGTLKKGACLVAGKAWAKVRTMCNDRGKATQSVVPGETVEVSGWKELPSAGDTVLQVESESAAREVVSWREDQDKLLKAVEELDGIQRKHVAHRQEYEELRQQKLDRGYRRGSIYGRIRTKEAIERDVGSEFSIVFKGDVDGTVDAVLNVLGSYDNKKCLLSILQYGVGDVTEQDIDMAASFSGHVYAFNVTIPQKINDIAIEKGVTIHQHNVIYKMIDDLKEELTQRIPEEDVEDIVGEADVLQHFTISDKKNKLNVAGSRCVKGILDKSKHFSLVRDGERISSGSLSSLRHFKQEVDIIKESQDCGLMFKEQDVEPMPGDRIICFDILKVKPDLDWDLEF